MMEDSPETEHKSRTFVCHWHTATVIKGQPNMLFRQSYNTGQEQINRDFVTVPVAKANRYPQQVQELGNFQRYVYVHTYIM